MDDDYDDDCLHCCLAKVLVEFTEKHPELEPPGTINAIATLLGDIISGFPEEMQAGIIKTLIRDVVARMKLLAEEENEVRH